MDLRFLWWTWRTIAEIESSDPKIRLRAVQRLGFSQSVVWVRWFAIGPLVDALRQADSAEMRREAEAALTRIKNARAVEPLVAALQDRDSAVRSSAARILGEIGSRQAIEPLAAALQDLDREVRLSAAWALALISDKEAEVLTIPLAIETLVQALSDERPAARKTAARALGLAENPQPVEALIKAMSDEDRDVRVEVIQALGEIGDKRAVESLLAVLGDKDSDMQGAAAYALGRAGDARAIEHLAAALEEPHREERVRIAIITALSQIQDERVIQPLTMALEVGDWQARQRAAQALDARDWRPANDRQRALHAIVLRRWYKFETLGPAAIDVLIEQGGLHNLEALLVLAKLGDPRAVKPLINFVNDPTQAQTAAGALQIVLERAAGAIATEDLQAVMALNDSMPTGYWYGEGGWGGLVDTEPANCSQVKKLARQELLRRGLPA